MGKSMRRPMEKAYREVYDMPNNQKLTNVDDIIINGAVKEICLWPGRFPGETDTMAVDNRETDKKAFTGDISGICRYLKKFGIYDNNKSDWHNIYNIYKLYVEPNPKGDPNLVVANDDGYKNVDSEPSVQGNQVSGEVPASPSIEETSLSNKNTSLKEEPTMGVNPTTNTNKTVEDLLNNANNEAEVQGSAANAVSTANKILGAQATPVVTGSGVGLVDKETATSIAQQSIEESMPRRQEYFNNTKILKLCISSRPIADRIPAEVTTGTLKNPVAFRDKVLKKVFEGDPQNANRNDEGKDVNGQYIIPERVARVDGANNIAKYKAFMEELNAACEDANHQIELNKTHNLGPWKGALVSHNGKDEAYGWKDMKIVLYKNSTGKLVMSGDDSVQLQIKSVSVTTRNGKERKIKDEGDLVVIQVVGKDKLVDTETGTITSDQASFVMDIDTSKKEIKGGVRSKVNFKCYKDPSANDANAKGRNLTIAMVLTCEQYKTVLSDQRLKQFEPAAGVGGVVTAKSDDEMRAILATTAQAAIMTGKMSNSKDLMERVQEEKNARQQEASATAAEMASNF